MATMNTVWDRTTEFVGDNLAALTPIVLFGLFVPLALVGNLVPLMGAVGLTGGSLVGVLVVLLSLASNWGATAVTALALDPRAGRAAAIRTANRRFLPVVGVNVVVLVTVFLLFLPAMIGFAMSGIPMTPMTGEPPALDTINAPIVLASSFYALVLMILLWWLVARLCVVTPTIVAEPRGLGAFKRAFRLTKGLALKIMGVILLYLVVSQVAGRAAQLVAGTVFGLLLGGVGPMSASAILTACVAALVSTLFSVLAVAFLAQLYLATRAGRDAPDMPHSVVEAA